MYMYDYIYEYKHTCTYAYIKQQIGKTRILYMTHVTILGFPAVTQKNLLLPGQKDKGKEEYIYIKDGGQTSPLLKIKATLYRS